MKKLSAMSLMLSIVLVLQLLLIPVHATEATEESVPQTLPSAAGETAPSVEFGTATVLNGCRTINAQMPLGGSDRKLETAVSAFVFERNTGTVIYAYNPDMEVQPGTFAKLVAAIVAIENGDLNAKVTVNSLSYTSLPPRAATAKPFLKEGEELTLNDLLHLMVLTWANDATITIAEHIAGTQVAFVDMMNEWVVRAGCTNTHFGDCHGLGSENQRITARDLARIIQEATKNPVFRELFAADKYEVPATNRTEEPRSIKSLNYLKEETIVPQYNFEGVTGGIAHYTETSGASLVCTAEKNGMSYTVVVLGCERKFNADKSWVVESYGNYEEAWVLLEDAFDNYKLCRLRHSGESMNQFDLAGGETDSAAQPHTSMDAVIPASARLDNMILKYTVQGGGLKAPIKADQIIGHLQVWYRTSCIVETELYAMSSVRSAENSELDIRSTATRDDSNLSGFLSFIGIVCLVILIPFVAYLVINNIRRAVARNRRRRRRQGRRRSR